MSDGVVALLWLGVPLVAWLLIARTRHVGLPVGVVLMVGLATGIVVVSTGTWPAVWFFLIVAFSADILSAGEMPAAPAGFMAVGDDEGCGSSSCYRSRTYAIAPNLPLPVS